MGIFTIFFHAGYQWYRTIMVQVHEPRLNLKKACCADLKYRAIALLKMILLLTIYNFPAPAETLMILMHLQRWSWRSFDPVLWLETRWPAWLDDNFITSSMATDFGTKMHLANRRLLQVSKIHGNRQYHKAVTRVRQQDCNGKTENLFKTLVLSSCSHSAVARGILVGGHFKFFAYRVYSLFHYLNIFPMGERIVSMRCNKLAL